MQEKPQAHRVVLAMNDLYSIIKAPLFLKALKGAIIEPLSPFDIAGPRPFLHTVPPEWVSRLYIQFYHRRTRNDNDINTVLVTSSLIIPFPASDDTL